MRRATRLLALFKGGRDDGARAEDEPRDEPPVSIAILVVYDPTDEIMAEQLVDAIQPRLSVPVRTASHVAEAERYSKAVNVAAMLVSTALQQNELLVEAVARSLPNALLPVVIDARMTLQKSWRGAISYHMANELYFDFCSPNAATISYLLDQFRDKVNGVRLDKEFDVFISHEWGVHDIAKKIAELLESDHHLTVWLDEREASRGVDASMFRGIDASKVFLVLATERYMGKINRGDRSDNCFKEFYHAGNQRAHRIVVAAVEEDMIKAATKWDGQFQLALSRQTPVDLTNLSDKAIECLANAIRMRIQTPEASSDLTPLMRDIYSRLNPCNSEVWAKGKAEKFTLGTRSWIIDELCDWYNKEQSAVFILVGDGGVGKSVIMAELCHRGGALKTDEDVEKSKADESAKPRRKSSRVRSLWRRSKNERQPIFVAAYHFFRHDDGTAASPAEAVLSIAWQLCQAVPHFTEALEQACLKGLREKTLADLFRTILVDPLSKLASDQVRNVVVLDALDACSKSDDVLRNMIRTWQDVMPAWLSLVVSTRSEGEIQRVITNDSLDFKVLELKDEENFRDIELYIEDLLCDMSEVVEQMDAASCAKILSERSEGLFLWASFLRETLQRMHEGKRGGLLTIQDISKKDAIPNGLGGMFHEYFERLQGKLGGEEKYKMLLAPIVAAREPLSVEQLSAILQSDPDDMDGIINDAPNLLYRGGDGRVALIHKRMADWLLDDDLSGNLGVDIDDGHIALADYCNSSRDDGFSLRHAVFHLVKSGEHAAAFELLNDFAWVQSAISVGDDETQRHTTIGNLIRDCVELDIYFAPESDTPRFLSKAVHALSYDPNELASQVLARLGHDPKHPLAHGLRAPDQPWLEPTRTTLAHPRDSLLHVLKGHSAAVNSVAIEGDRIISGSRDGTARVWNASSGEEQYVLKGHSSWVMSVAIEGDMIVTGSKDKTVRIWNATSGKEQHALEGHSDHVSSVAIQGDTIVSGSDDKTVRIWNATTGTEQHVLEGHSCYVTSVAIQGNRIVSGSHDCTVRIWNATSGEEQRVLEGHSACVSSVAIEGNKLVSGSHDKTVRIWDATSGEELDVLKGHSGIITSVAIEDDTIVSGSSDIMIRIDNTVRIWNATSGEEQHVLRWAADAVKSVAIQGDRIVSGSGGFQFGDNTVRIWKATLREEQHLLKGHSNNANSVAIEGNIVVTGSCDNTVRIWNAASGEEQFVLKGHFEIVSSVAIEGNTIVSGSLDGTVRIWNATSGAEQHVLKGNFSQVKCVAIESDTVVSGSYEKTVHIWNATTGEEQHVLRWHFGPISSVAIEGDTIVSGSWDMMVCIWNATSGERRHVLKGHSFWITRVAIQGDIIVSGSEDKTVRIWNAASGEEQHVLKGHSRRVHSVAIQGDIIVSRSPGETRYWNARTGEALDADEAEASTTPGTNTLVNVENGTHVRLSGGVGFTTDHAILDTARQGSVYVIGDKSGMVHILHVQGIEPGT